MSPGLDAGLGHALLLPPSGSAEHLRAAHARIEQDQLVAGVDDRRVLFEHDIVRRQEIVCQHLLHLFLGNAGEGAGGIAERKRSVGDDGDFGIAENEAVPVGRLGAELGSARHRAAAEHCAGSKAGPKGQQGPT
ncbi:hypothetical protein ACVWZW_002041 [Bradyrhizobium sp. F1.13.4]